MKHHLNSMQNNNPKIAKFANRNKTVFENATFTNSNKTAFRTVVLFEYCSNAVLLLFVKFVNFQLLF